MFKIRNETLLNCKKITPCTQNRQNDAEMGLFLLAKNLHPHLLHEFIYHEKCINIYVFSQNKNTETQFCPLFIIIFFIPLFFSRFPLIFFILLKKSTFCIYHFVYHSFHCQHFHFLISYISHFTPATVIPS